MNKAILVALLSDLLTPFFIWKLGLPAEARWLSSAVLALLLMDGYARLLKQHRFPAALWLIAVLSLAGVARALLNGQSLAATAWGWWLMFRYPLVGLYVYLQPRSPEQSKPKILKWAILLLSFEVVVQLGQYATGQAPGDQLAGSLGQNGTGALALVVLLVLALALGDWIARGGLGRVALVTALGVVSSSLGEMKVFFFAAGAMAVISLTIHLWRKRRLGQVLPYALLLAAALVAFPSIYNTVVPGAQNKPFLQYLDPEVVTQYTTFVQAESNASYELGRVYGLVYAWDQVNGSPISMAFGDGLGARGESVSLGTTGVALLTGQLGIVIGGGSLSVVLGELGIVGILILMGFILWAARVLWKGAISSTVPETMGMQYGLLIYTLMWPVWLWYNTAWTLPVPMLLYWSLFGYCLAQSRRRETRLPAVWRWESGLVQSSPSHPVRQSRPHWLRRNGSGTREAEVHR